MRIDDTLRHDKKARGLRAQSRSLVVSRSLRNSQLRPDKPLLIVRRPLYRIVVVHPRSDHQPSDHNNQITPPQKSKNTHLRSIVGIHSLWELLLVCGNPCKSLPNTTNRCPTPEIFLVAGGICTVFDSKTIRTRDGSTQRRLRVVA
jgi:hypothetical protein